MLPVQKEVISMHERRKSDESIEITAYLLKHKKVDETDYQDVLQQLNFIKKELRKRGYAKKYHNAKENRNDVYIKDEQFRLKVILNNLRKEIDKNSSESKRDKKTKV